MLIVHQCISFDCAAFYEVPCLLISTSLVGPLSEANQERYANSSSRFSLPVPFPFKQHFSLLVQHNGYH